jgi:hypothetical protein
VTDDELCREIERRIDRQTLILAIQLVVGMTAAFAIGRWT